MTSFQQVPLAISVLIADDDEVVRRLLAECILSVFPDLKIHFAANGREGVARFREFRPSIVITDIRMPVMDGIRMIREIRETDREVRIIAMTAFGEMLDFPILSQFGIDYFIPKPFDHNELIETIGLSIEEVSRVKGG